MHRREGREVVAFGDAAYLIRVRREGATGLAESIRAAPPQGVIDVVAGEDTVLVTADPLACDMDGLEVALANYVPSPPPSRRHDPILVPVIYDGADLAEVAQRVGMSPQEVVAVHSAATYTVSYLGFAPGFAYLDGLDRALWIERRAVPRAFVPGGSVAIANHRSCVYPGPGPGGWHLLGRTDVTLFDPGADPPALFAPGDTVRFEAVDPT